MTVDKAIEILQDLDTTLPQSSPEDRREAVKLGIEALKCVLKVRHHPFPEEVLLLPGETTE